MAKVFCFERKELDTMPASDSNQMSLAWLAFALMTVVSWGVYGILLHTGQIEMRDPVNGRYKAFLFVGIAYFLTAVLAPIALLVVRGATWSMPTTGMTWSLLAGIVGAIGAFCVLLAFGAAPKPTVAYVPVVMSIIFAGAPIVNSVVATTKDHNWGNVRLPFVLGIVLAAIGGALVTLYKPEPKPHGPSANIVAATPANSGS
jgi:uncharacterized membrane protein YeaQ/YmgE (transglycosylase-associated protein family)